MTSAPQRSVIYLSFISSYFLAICSFSAHKKIIRRSLWIDDDKHILTISDDKVVRFVYCSFISICIVFLFIYTNVS